MHNKDKWMDGLALRRENGEAVIKEKRRRGRFSFCCTVLSTKLEATVCPQNTLALQSPEQGWLWDTDRERLYPKPCCVWGSVPSCCPAGAGAGGCSLGQQVLPNREQHTARPAPAAGNNKGVKAGAAKPVAQQERSSEQLTFTELLPCALP